jgi:hypothetical protein
VGRSLSDLAPELLPTQAAQHVLSGKYSDAKDPRGQLLAMEVQLERRRELVAADELKHSLVEAQKRGGDRELVRLQAQLAQARRKGDRELAEQLAQQISSNRNQVD